MTSLNFDTLPKRRNCFKGLCVIDGKMRLWRWRIATQLKRRGLQGRRFATDAKVRVLLLSQPNEIAQSQIFPFHFYAKELAKRGFAIKEISTDLFSSQPDSAPDDANVVLVQARIVISTADCRDLLSKVRQKYPRAKVVFLDYFAPTDLRYAMAVEPYADVYLKKHVLRDRSKYLRPTLGDTNLVDYYGRLYGIEYAPVLHDLPPNFFAKLKIGPSFCTGPTMLPNFHDSATNLSLKPSIDVHGRLGFKGVDWYQAMRENAIQIIESMKDISVVSTLGVKRNQYMAELRSARVCVSPFGYGEVCWRDYEAIMCGAILLKPDMSHLETNPDIFVANETYVPIAWDFSDLEEKIRKFLADEAQRKSIVTRAYQRLHQYASSGEFVNQIEPVLSV